jgi:hypothetical protein
MTRPLPTSTEYTLLKPATLDLAEAVGKAMVTASPERMVVLSRIYSNMLPAAKARCDFARSWLIVSA